ncbi:ATP-binding cassette sub-family A member 3 [Reticulomyxa filosa]|uniref:ATP-binding cassette sub-family A member 3 n=1 Tax=Reticulomyxa filosa TaxID=46433 RepID=X6NTW3_RETFI|nr:ATP-binding cassette sub-family A member 3 [Reticulomyxa filosa]|eukprot:ETO29229.1 ATP-binding cassette sub-family A member 3 [Reticulomyxa filosa]
MEEAEFLANRVAIIDNGLLQCIGTPQHLKQKYAQGYELIVNEERVKQHESQRDEIVAYFLSMIDRPHCGFLQQVDLIETTPTSLKFRLLIRQGCDDKEDDNDDNRKDDNDRKDHSTSVFSLATLFQEVESVKEKFGILEYSLSQTTLEQVFAALVKHREAESML